MYRVATVHLSADASRADPSLDSTPLGEISASEISGLLERFRRLSVAENHEAEPYLEIIGRSGKFHVRTGRGKLYLYNARDSVEPYAELTPAEILAQLERLPGTVAPFAVRTESGETARPPARFSSHRGIAAAILAAGLLLNGYTVYSVSSVESVQQKSDVKLLTDAREAAARRAELAGTYATGGAIGDRIIVVLPDGRVDFSEVGRKSQGAVPPDTSKLGRRGSKLCLVTGESGLIDVPNIDTLVYYRDTYRRTR